MEGWRLLPQMLESMLSGTGSGGGAFGALQKLLKSGIPGLENLFGQNADGSLKWDDIITVVHGVSDKTVMCQV